MRPRHNGRHFTYNIFKCIFLNENVWISIKISLKVVPKGLINNIPSLVQIMACWLNGDKPLSELMMVSLLMHICVTRPQWIKGMSLWWPLWGLLSCYYVSKWSHCSLFDDGALVDEIFGCIIFIWVTETSLHWQGTGIVSPVMNTSPHPPVMFLWCRMVVWIGCLWFVIMTTNSGKILYSVD